MPANDKFRLRNLFISPTEARLRAGWRIGLHLVILALLLVLIGMVIGLVEILFGWQLPALLAYLGSAIAISASIYIARRWIDKRSFTSLGLNWDESARRDLMVGIAIAAVMMGAIFLTAWLFGWIEVEGVKWRAPDGSSVFAGLLSWFAIFVLVAWAEELYSRGYLLQNLAEGLSLPISIFISSTLFSLAHLLNPSASWMSVLGILAAGVFFALSYVWTQRLWLAIGLHLGWNFFEGPIFGFPVSGLETVKLVQINAVGPELITGGAFGPEAGLILFPALALGNALIYLYTAADKLVEGG